MQCPYCNASNIENDHRCRRCGRRFDTLRTPASAPRPEYAPDATARALNAYQNIQDQPAPDRAPQETARTPIQRALFSSRIVSMETYAPEAIQKIAEHKTARQRRVRRDMPGQESLAFDAVLAELAPEYSAESGIFHGAAVASPLHRLFAAAFDLALIAVACALFLLPVYFAALHSGSSLWQTSVGRHAAPVLVALLAAFYLMYEIMWSLAGTDTAGMRRAHLKLMNFDGQPPDRKQRLMRVGAAALSVLAAGLGLIWALADEESLAWHDHISKSFPMPY